MTRRTGLSRRGWTVLVLLTAITAAVALAPEEPLSARLQLVALDTDGRFRDSVRIGRAAARPPSLTGSLSRVPLVLGVRNTGRRSARPARLELSVPERVRLTTDDGRELPAAPGSGGPLVRYVFEPAFRTVAPQRLPALLPELDTLWIEVVVPSVHCVLLADSVPELIPAAAPETGTLASIRIFYAFQGGDLRERQAGVLRLVLDEALVGHGAPEPFRIGTPGPLSVPEPDTATLQHLGSAVTACGDPEHPIPMRSEAWGAAGNSLLLVLALDGNVRKHLYDADGDGIIEREAWDDDGDGRMDLGRSIRLPIPDALMPPTPDAASAPAPEP